MSSETSQFPKPDIRRVTSLVNTDTNERYLVGAENVTIGREPDNVISLHQDIYASGHHAQVFFEKGECWLRDLGSRNGTLVNNVTVPGKVTISIGDLIVIGRTKLKAE